MDALAGPHDAGKLLSRLKAGTMSLADRGNDVDWIGALAAKN
jgi:hypothetical protein